MNTKEPTSQKGKLYLVSTPIGNKDDITLRAINTIKRCDIVVCEEMKMGALALKNLNLAKEMIPLNENNESEMTFDVIDLLKSGKKIALISDAGTPVFADPGLYLVKQAIKNDIEIEVVPGVSSIMTAIVRSGFELYEFLYAGFLPRRNEDRDRKLQKLAKERRTVVIFDTPYRLVTLLEACARTMPNRKAYIGMNMTMAFETHHYGTFTELFNKFKETKTKSEFVIVMEGDKEWMEHRKDKIDSHSEANEDGYDDDDEEVVIYEYPVKAHQKSKEVDRFKRDVRSHSERPFSPTAGGSRYKRDDRSDSGSRYRRDGDSRSDSGSRYRRDGDSRSDSGSRYRRDGDSRYKKDDRKDGRRSSWGDDKRDNRGDKKYRKPDGEKSFGRDKTPKGAPRKFRKDNLEPSFGGKRKFSNFSKNKGKSGRKNRSSK